jgi:hypothetical protein
MLVACRVSSAARWQERHGHASIRTTSDRYGHLYVAACDRLRDHLEDTYSETDNAHSNPA